MKPRAIFRALAAMTVTVLIAAACAAATAEPGEPENGQASFDPAFRHGKVAVDGGTLHYVRGGSGPPLVLLHGWLETWFTWHKVMPELAREHTVIAIDLPGLGDSSKPAGGY